MNNGLYIHIPFCESKCSYCDFVSFPGHHPWAQARYIDALCREMRLRVSPDVPVDTIFIGGGTPSALSERLWTPLLATLAELVRQPVSEWTVEMNPSSVNEALLRRLIEAGMTRLSLGVQSFAPEILTRLGRRHSAADVDQAVHLARAVGVQNLNLDLIYGVPGLTLSGWQETVKRACDYAPEHLSLYGLIVEPGTAMARNIDAGRLPEPDDGLAADCCRWHRSFLCEHGFDAYEISNYARPGHVCQHNLKYWRLEPWIGLGLAAGSWDGHTLMNNEAKLEAYCAALEAGRLPIAHAEVFDLEMEMSEVMIMGLRMSEGVDERRFAARFNCSIEDVFSSAIDRGLDKGWLQWHDRRLSLTPTGVLFGNHAFELFL